MKPRYPYICAVAALLFVFVGPTGTTADENRLFSCGVNLNLVANRQTATGSLSAPAPVARYWPSWSDKDDRFEQDWGPLVHQAGFDFVRLPVQPIPLMTAKTPDERSGRVRAVVDLVRQLTGAGLGVDISMLPSDPDPVGIVPSVTAGGPMTRPYFDVVEGIVEELHAAKILGGRLALEIMNEPQPTCGGQTWPRVQQDEIIRLKAIAPELKIMYMADCWDSIDGLLEADPGALARDPKILFSFHYYQPWVLFAQGSPWTRSEIHYADQVPYPVAGATLAEVEAPTMRRLDQATDLTEEDRTKLRQKIHFEIKKYVDEGWDSRRIHDRIAEVAAWADRFHIAHDRILLGEFGISRPKPGEAGATYATREAYYHDVTAAASSLGFGWAQWTNADGMDAPGKATLDPLIVKALLSGGGRHCQANL